MLHEHGAFPTPPDDVPIWRYLDLAKFVSMLTTKSLYFSRADLLGDPFEGSYPRANKATLNIPAKQVTQWVYVNCWHENEHESAAMWAQYIKSGEGIALRSSVGRLKRSTARDETVVFVGRVKYIDYEKDGLPAEALGNVLHAFAHKRKSFEHEREVRALTVGNSKTTKLSGGTMVLPVGVSVAADLSELLESVHVAPGSPTWFLEVVKSITDRFGLLVAVKQSALDAAPLF